MEIIVAMTTGGFDSGMLLKSTPYLIEGSVVAEERFERVVHKGSEIRDLAERVGRVFAEQTTEVFESFGLILRSELVSESNRMEHIDWSPSEIRDLVQSNRDLLALPAHSFVQAVRSDSRTYEALGLFRAQLLAEEWAKESRPREFEIRQLHGLIVGDAHYSGRYKVGDNRIGGAEHTPPSPADAAESMHELAEWWQGGTDSPILDATVVHAWLAHLHPFEDGNGRLARLLANVALAQHGYPPLVIRADSDRGEYYEALAQSDVGDLLPLLELFTRLLRRSVREMGRPDYVERVVRDRMLTTPTQQHAIWLAVAHHFEERLEYHLRLAGLARRVMGYPAQSAFESLADLNPDGNSWFIKVQGPMGQSRWLLWFGFNSAHYCDVFDGPSGFPSIFLSEKADSAQFGHPYRPLFDDPSDSMWTELVIEPGRITPIRVRVGHTWREFTVDDGAASVAGFLARS